MKKLATMVLCGLALTGCSHDINEAEMNQMLLQQSRGLIGGFEIGDSWDKLKAEHDKRYTVRDETMPIGSSETTYRQLRHDLGSPGDDGFYVGFQVDAQKNITSIDTSIYGRHGNAVVIRKFLDDVIAHFDKKVGNGHCSKTPGGRGNSSSCQWEQKGGVKVEVLYLEFSDPIGGQLTIHVMSDKK